MTTSPSPCAGSVRRKATTPEQAAGWNKTPNPMNSLSRASHRPGSRGRPRWQRLARRSSPPGGRCHPRGNRLGAIVVAVAGMPKKRRPPAGSHDTSVQISSRVIKGGLAPAERPGFDSTRAGIAKRVHRRSRARWRAAFGPRACEMVSFPGPARPPDGLPADNAEPNDRNH